MSRAKSLFNDAARFVEVGLRFVEVFAQESCIGHGL